MNTFRLGNISLSDFRRFLQHIGCKKISISGGHEKWKKEGGLRTIIIQTHLDPIPERVVRSNLKTLGLTRKDLEQFLLHHE